MAMVSVDNSSLHGWLGQRVGSCVVLLYFYVHQMNWVKSRNDFVMMTAPQTLSWVLLLLVVMKETYRYWSKLCWSARRIWRENIACQCDALDNSQTRQQTFLKHDTPLK